MSRNNLSDTWDSEEHPSLDVLRQYQTGDLSAHLSHQIERHLVSCELCSDLVEGMSLSQPTRVKSAVRETRGRLKDLLAQKKRKRRVFQWPIWQTAAVILVLLFAIGEVVYHQYFAKPESQKGQSTETTGTWRLTGQVVDASGKALSNATVIVKGSGVQALVDEEGEFYLDLQKRQAMLMVSKAGFTTKEVTVSSANPSVEIVLTP
ncbi:carboxypeptidase-like regulatory domain-containing protein [Rufibacter latericius]|uniref:Zinc-finger domain-containing protein n=1 Tax=Rufibacter latericius TaxID=2487040 RepID=A0A3M9MBM4_9BACT|nr:carboxypeptidase-like regulatory domain-containing protein [Rufibacter latericius]RNI21988.1 hypothetical protein EFB08_22915 [Rufibacter latericius]